MVLCKFYANGYCKFGERCRFEHYTSSHNNNRYSNTNQQQSKGSASTFSFNRTFEQLSSKSQQPNFFGIASSNPSFFGNRVVSSANSGSANGFSFNKMLQQISTQPTTAGSQQVMGGHNLSNMNNAGHSSQINPSGGKFSFANTASSIGSQSSSFVQSFVNSATQQFGNKPNLPSASFFTASSTSVPSNRAPSFFESKPILPSTQIGSSTVSPLIYSQLSQISDQDRHNFEAQQFTSPIPIVPPPYEVCF